MSIHSRNKSRLSVGSAEPARQHGPQPGSGTWSEARQRVDRPRITAGGADRWIGLNRVNDLARDQRRRCAWHEPRRWRLGGNGALERGHLLPSRIRPIAVQRRHASLGTPPKPIPWTIRLLRSMSRPVGSSHEAVWPGSRPHPSRVGCRRSRGAASVPSLHEDPHFVAHGGWEPRRRT